MAAEKNLGSFLSTSGAGVLHRCSVVTSYICKIMVVIACSLIQAGVIMVARWPGKLPLWFSFGVTLTDVQWLQYLQDHSCYCMLFDTNRCAPSQMFSGYFGCKMAWEASSVVFLCMQLSLFLQVVCN